MSTVPSSAGIYKITCIANNKVYIGSTTDVRKRWYWHKGDLRANRHHNSHLQFAWNKYGEQSFEFEILEMVMFVEHLHEREQYWLDFYQAYDQKKGFNTGKVAQAPWLGRSHTDETKQKLSDRARQQMTDEDMRRLTSQASEWHGSDDGRNWHSGQARRTWAIWQAKTYQCQYCGTEYSTRTMSQTRFCSNRCRAAARRAQGADEEARQCVVCGEMFSCNKYMPTQCCSRSCAAYWRESRKRQ